MLGKEVCKVNTTAVSAEKPINVLFTAADVKLLDVFTKEIQYSDTGGDESCRVKIKKKKNSLWSGLSKLLLVFVVQTSDRLVFGVNVL